MKKTVALLSVVWIMAAAVAVEQNGIGKEFVGRRLTHFLPTRFALLGETGFPVLEAAPVVHTWPPQQKAIIFRAWRAGLKPVVAGKGTLNKRRQVAPFLSPVTGGEEGVLPSLSLLI